MLNEEIKVSRTCILCKKEFKREDSLSGVICAKCILKRVK